MRRPILTARSHLHHFVGIGLQNLSDRHGPEQEAAGEGQQQREKIHIRVGRHRQVSWKSGKRLPLAKLAQEKNAARQPDGSAGQRDQNGFGEQAAQNSFTA